MLEVQDVEMVTAFIKTMTEAQITAFGQSIEDRLEGIPHRHEIVINCERKGAVEGITHAKFDEVLTYLSAGEPVYLHGPAGSGKNVIAEQCAKALDVPFYSASTLLQKYELLGYGDANGVYQATSFYQAFTEGGIFFLDEFDGCSPEVAIALNGALANGYMDFPIKGFKYANPNFRCIAAGNTVARGANEMYNGRFQLDAATIDRFSFVEVDYDERIELNLAGNDKELVKFIHDIRKSAAENSIQIVAGYRAIKKIHKLMSSNLPLCTILEGNLYKGLDREDRTKVTQSMSMDSEFVLASIY